MNAKTLTFKREPVAVESHWGAALDRCAVVVAQCNRDQSGFSRVSISQQCETIGCWTYIGGCHVSIHQQDGGPCLATVTGNFGDWI